MGQEFDPRKPQLSGEPRLIFDEPNLASATDVHVSASRTGLLLYGAFGQTTQKTWVDREGKVIGQLGEPGRIFLFRLSPDERRIAVQRGSPIADLWIMDAQNGLESRFTAGASTSTQPVWSPDGRLYLSCPSGKAA